MAAAAGWTTDNTKTLLYCGGEGGGGEGGGAHMQSQLDGVVCNKVVYEKIAHEKKFGFDRTWQ